MSSRHLFPSDVVHLGKIAISYEILLAEGGSLLYNALRGVRTFEDCDMSWAGQFLDLAVGQTKSAEVETVFQNVTVIDFNYDRVLPEYLHSALQRRLDVPSDKAAKCVAGLRILRPYGSIGVLPWQPACGTAVEFGAFDYDLSAIATRIRTYTEESEGRRCSASFSLRRITGAPLIRAGITRIRAGPALKKLRPGAR
jgi:hypothetical protein